MEGIKEKIEKQLLAMGCNASSCGFCYLVSGVMYAVESREDRLCMAKGLYQSVANRYGSTPTRVERVIRNQIDKMYMNGNASEYPYFAPNSRSGKLTNADFIARMAIYIKLGV